MKKLIVGIAVLVLLVGGTSVAFGRGVSGVEGSALSKACPEPSRRVGGEPALGYDRLRGHLGAGMKQEQPTN
jgi:hypothetical protein